MEQSEQKLNSEKETPQFIGCFLCGDKLEIRNSKKLKPYFICDGCGLQAFVRREKGIKRLKKISSADKPELNSTLELINQFESLKIKLGEIKTQQKWSFSESPELELQAKALIREISGITAELKKRTQKPE